MAKAKAKTDVQELTDRVLAQVSHPPDGAQAAPGDFAAKLRKALPHILTGLMLAGEIAEDGQVSADEVKLIAGKVYEFIRGFRSGPQPAA